MEWVGVRCKEKEDMGGTYGSKPLPLLSIYGGAMAEGNATYPLPPLHYS